MARYIGARYVPIMGGAWDNTREYEPLTVVQYEGDSYTSKIYVPVGVAITNTTYWVKTADYSQQLASLAQSLQQTDGRVQDIEGNVQDLQRDLGTAQDDITAAKTTLRNLGGRFMIISCSVEISSTAAGASNSGSATIRTDSNLDAIGIVGVEMNGSFALKTFGLSGKSAFAHVYNMDSVARGGEVLLYVLYYDNAAL